MAKNLVWRDLSSEQIDRLRRPHPRAKPGREVLAEYLGIGKEEQHQPKTAITLDLYVHTLQYGQELKLANDKLSALLSIVKSTHEASVAGKMPVERSFALFKELVLGHSVQRPPFSVGLFTLGEMKQILEWFVDAYYRHYKLYIYAFTDRVVMSVQQRHPLDFVELAPLPLLPLVEALTEQQHEAALTEEQRKREREEAAAREAEAAAAEEARKVSLREAYEAAIPEEIKDRVQAAVEKELAMLKKAMEERFEAQTKELTAKIGALEASAQAPPTPAEGKGGKGDKAPAKEKAATAAPAPEASGA